jgi:hypothetical protein
LRVSQQLVGTIVEVKRSRSLVVAAGLVPVLAACVSSYGCNAVGCTSHVSVDLTRVGTEFGRLPASATLCVNGDCSTTAVQFTGTSATGLVAHNLTQESLTSDGQRITVTVLLERDGTALVDTAAETELTRLAPNGEKCDPICHVASFVLTGTQLKRVPVAAV